MKRVSLGANNFLQSFGSGNGRGVATGKGSRHGTSIGYSLDNPTLITYYEVKEIQHERKNTELRVRNGKR